MKGGIIVAAEPLKEGWVTVPLKEGWLTVPLGVYDPPEAKVDDGITLMLLE